MRRAVLALTLAAPLVAPAAAAAAWSSPRQVSASGFTQEVAVDAAGRVTLLWQSSSPFAPQRPVMVSEAHLGRRRLTTTTLSRAGTSMALAVNAAGAAVAAWFEPDGGRCGVPIFCAGALRVSTRPAGGRFGAPVTLSSAVIGGVAAALGPRGDALVAGLASGGSVPGGGHLVLFARGGGDWQQTTPDEANVGSNVGGVPAVAVGGDGSALAVWARPADQQAAGGTFVVRRAGRGAFGPATRLSGESATEVAAHVDARGRDLVAWDDGSMRAARRTRGAWRSQRLPGLGGRFELAAAPSGAAVLLWSAGDRLGAGDAEVLGSRRSPGGAFRRPVRVLTAGAAGAGRFDVALSTPERALIAWAQPSGARALRVATMFPVGRPREARLVSRSAVVPRLATGRRGAALAFSRFPPGPPAQVRLMLSTGP
ncbi:MAG: hypothetical protein QOE65_2830 [Solirubrobacteraceae bacterium]|jgi:hypothetical protein|nr:hypothetical protein [Solirubrobacteraceae bacterium]